MPSLQQLLEQSMLFTAASGGKAAPDAVELAPMRTPEPRPTTARQLEEYGKSLDEDTVRVNPIWRFSWDPSRPAAFTKITIKSRGMGMDYGMPCKVYDEVAFEKVFVVREDGTKLELSLDAAHMIGAWHARVGHIHPLKDQFLGRSNPLWQLDTRIDHSMLVAFAFQQGGSESVLTLAQCDALGEDLIPAKGSGAPVCAFVADAALPEVRAEVCVGAVRYVVLVELVLCKEHNDFVPGGINGFARIHPHAMVWSTEALRRVETSIVMARPRRGMSHGDSMHDRHKALVVTDTNYPHSPSAAFGPFPIPLADTIYDYYEVEPARVFAERAPIESDHPQQRTGEITLADARFRGKRRRITDAVTRRSRFAEPDRDILKEPRQGQFDNVHIGVRMRLEMAIPEHPPFPFAPNDTKTVLADDNLSMIFMCVHDCCHMHVRWSAMFTDPIIAGWRGDTPNAEPGAPQVPENQTVFASFPNEHTLRYRAIAEKVDAGALTIFCHHGLAYAIDLWPTTAAKLAMAVLFETLATMATTFHEPYWNGTPNDQWSLFYFRVRYCGPELEHGKWQVQERLSFDRETCMR